MEPATKAWIGLAVGVAAYDALAPQGQTLSEGVDRALEHPAYKYLAFGIGGLVAGHLFNVIPERVDPLHYLSRFIARSVELVDEAQDVWGE